MEMKWFAGSYIAFTTVDKFEDFVFGIRLLMGVYRRGCSLIRKGAAEAWPGGGVCDWGPESRVQASVRVCMCVCIYVYARACVCICPF